MSEYCVSIGILSQLRRYLEHLKIDLLPFYDSLGIDPGAHDNPDIYIPFETYIAAENRAAALSGDPYFGIHMGEFVCPGHYSIVGYLMMSSANLGEAMAKLGRYNRLIGTLITGRLSFGIGTAKLTLAVPKGAPEITRHCVECASASILTLARHLTGTDIRPLRAGFSGSRPADVREYERIFRSPVRFGERDDYLLLDPAVGSLPVLAPDTHLSSVFEEHARAFLADLEEHRPVSTRVRRILLSKIDSKHTGLPSIASALAMSPRTLQSRLKAEHTTYQDILDETRKRLAVKYLDERRTVEEIAYLLGYSQTAVFSKVFRKWYGESPRSFRAQRASGGV